MADAAGKPLTIRELNRVIGSLANDVENVFERVADTKQVIDQYTSAQLAALPADGVTGFQGSPDGDNVKSFLTDMAQLRDLYIGAATLGVAKDFRAFTKRLRGFESV